MKKIIFALVLAIGLISPSLRGMGLLDCDDPKHSSTLLKDQKWHNLKFYACINENSSQDEWHFSTIPIRQKTANGDYEFKTKQEKAALEFYYFLSWFGITQISMEKTTTGYEGAFYYPFFVPGVEVYDLFIGIDVN